MITQKYVGAMSKRMRQISIIARKDEEIIYANETDVDLE